MKKNASPPVLNSYTIVFFWLFLIVVCTFVFQKVLNEKHNPNQNLEVLVNANGSKEIVLKQNSQGHYLANGEINGQQVEFLVDTGATFVSIPEHLAKRLNLNKGREYQSSTANGLSTSFETTIYKLSLGDITMKNVPASIGAGMDFDQVLLGMSFLKHLDLKQQSDRLTLTVSE